MGRALAQTDNDIDAALGQVLGMSVALGAEADNGNGLAVEAANSDLEGTAALCEQYGVVAKAALAQKALPQCNIVFETGDEMKTDLETYFKVLYAADPASVGGALPADDFYYAG